MLNIRRDGAFVDLCSVDFYVHDIVCVCIDTDNAGFFLVKEKKKWKKDEVTPILK